MQRSPHQNPDEIIQIDSTIYVPVEMEAAFREAFPTPHLGQNPLFGLNVVFVYPPEPKPRLRWWVRLWRWMKGGSYE